ncbi:MAG: hypothetical protein ACRDTC_24535 [Pseudonocardiaceae bacterium]
MLPLSVLDLEIAWCPACRADCLVEIITLDGDPGPVAVCVDCGLGVESWPLPELITEARPGVKAS